mmetsp:Transcript_111249/g.287608  ORF Transcript_111249/g.287608 Transcript_111249/m.287608 type:complete len:153 (+) Transcript_111249:101-559(+)
MAPADVVAKMDSDDLVVDRHAQQAKHMHLEYAARRMGDSQLPIHKMVQGLDGDRECLAGLRQCLDAALRMGSFDEAELLLGAMEDAKTRFASHRDSLEATLPRQLRARRRRASTCPEGAAAAQAGADELPQAAQVLQRRRFASFRLAAMSGA